MIDGKKVLYSGMQSTGALTLGNYLGALRNWVKISDEYETFYMVANLHSITVRQEPAALRKSARSILTLYIAAGLDPEKNCNETDLSGLMEGLYIKVEENGRVVDRMKFVRAAFLQCVDFSETHWIDKPIIPNQLAVPVESLF